MSYDDNGNIRVDFAWGNMPAQPNDDRWGYVWPGDGESEYFILGHDDGYIHSQDLEAVGMHRDILRHRKSFPDYDANIEHWTVPTDWWWGSEYQAVPATEMPNIIGKTVADAFKQLANAGVPDQFLTDYKTDNTENPYDAGAWVEGIAIYRYMDPAEQIGWHWDGRPWFAYEADGLVADVATWTNFPLPIAALDGDEPWWLNFVVIQTTDSTKDSWSWWN